MAPRLPAPTTGPDACKVWEIKTQRRADDAKAREMLERTAWQVQREDHAKARVARGDPARDADRVKDRYGDNWNKGERVRLKLRKGDGEWFDYEHVVLVMLHELCHNDAPAQQAVFRAPRRDHAGVRGPHGARRRRHGAGFDAKGTATRTPRRVG